MAKVDQLKSKAQELFQRGDYAKAVAEYKKVLEIEPGNAGIYNFIGDAYIKMNNIDEAISNYQEAMKYYSADALHNNAVAICRKILRYRKDDPELYKTLGELYIHQGLINEAITNLLEYAERKMKEGRQDLAFPVYKQIVELNPQNLNIRAKLAEMYLAEKRMAEAVNEFSLLAQAYRDQGRQIEAEALEARVRSMRGEPAAPSAAPTIEIKPAKVIEEILQQKQETAPPPPSFSLPPAPEIVIEKETAPVTAEEPPKQDWATNIELGDLLVEIGSTQEALDQYHTAAQGYLSDGNHQKAVEVYKKIADLQPLELRSRQKLVEIALESNQPEALVEAYLGLAECLRRRELKEQAAGIYQKILEIDPVNEMALENLSLLLPELPEGAVELPGMEIHPEPAAAAPAPEVVSPEPMAYGAPPEFGAFISAEEPSPAAAPEMMAPVWAPAETPAEEEQSFIVAAPEPEAPPEAVEAGEAVSDQAKVHWGRDIVEGGRQSRVKFSVADQAPAPAAQEEFLSLSEILAEFKEGVFQQVGKEEYRQHYDLGISYKEMGLLEEAISEFQLASKGEQERLAAFEMLGLCFMERGEPKFAIKQFERGLATPGHSEEEYIGLHYYMGLAYEQMGDMDRARECYETVYGMDVTFRDVAQRLAALRPAVEPTPIPEPSPQPGPLRPTPAARPAPTPVSGPMAAPRPAPAQTAKPITPTTAKPQPAAPMAPAVSATPAASPAPTADPGMRQAPPAAPVQPAAPQAQPLRPMPTVPPVRPPAAPTVPPLPGPWSRPRPLLRHVRLRPCHRPSSRNRPPNQSPFPLS